jgi:group I intron endonuclease
MLTSPSGKRYIGQTINLKNRMQKYACNDSKGQVAIYRAIKKYGWENFDVDILLEVKRKYNIREVLNIFESAFIRRLNTIDPYGYNLTYGGDYKKLSASTIEKMRLANLGQKRTSEAKMNMSASGLNMDVDKREKINNAIRGMSLEARERINIANKINKSIEVCQYSLDGKLLNTYSSIKSASITTGIFESGIWCVARCIRNRMSAGGYVWKYKDSEKITISENNKIFYSNIIKPKGILRKEILQFSIDGLFISQFNSIKQASVCVGTSPNNISACLTKVTNTAGGYK